MPKLVCLDCQVSYRIEKTGAFVLEMAYNPPQPYKLWQADVWRCPGCGRMTVAGFAESPVAEHWQDKFDDLLEKVKAGKTAQDGWLIEWHERPRVPA